MYQKVHQLRGRNTKSTRKIGIKDSQYNIVTDHLRALKVCGKSIQDIYDLENRPKDSEIYSEEEINEDNRIPTILKSEVVKAVKDMRRKKSSGNVNIPVDLLKELGDNGLKIMSTLVNKIYMRGDWSKDF